MRDWDEADGGAAGRVGGGPETEPERSSEPGTAAPRAPGWEPVRLLGAGAQAEVWLVEDGRGVRAALKVPRAGAAPDALAAEAQAGRVAHPHLLRVLGVVETDRGLGVLTEHRAAGTLQDMVQRVGPLSPGQAVTVLVPIAQALACLHREGVVHGDVSPANVLFGVDGSPAHAATPTTRGSETARARAPTGGGATPGRPRGRRAGHRAGRRRRHRRAVVAGVPGRRDGGGAGAGGRGAGRHLGGRGAPGGRDAGERDAGEGAGRGCPRRRRRRGGRRRRGRGAGRGRPRPDCRAHRPGACATGRLRRARGTGVGERPGSAAPADGRGVRLLRPRGDGGAGRTRPAGRGRRAACRRRAPDVGPHRAGPRGTRGGASGGDGRGGRAGPAQRPRRGPRGAGRRRGGSDVAGRDRRSALTPGPDPAPEAGGPDGGTPRAPGRSSPGPAAWCGVSRLG
nr:protein kinase [Micrococcus luteus]